MSLNRTRYGLVAALAVGLAAAGMSPAAAADPIAPAPTPTTGNPTVEPTDGAKDAPGADKMSPHSQDLLVQAEADGKARVTIMALAEKGKTQEVVDQLKRMGATIGYTQEKVGYVRASIPTGKALEVARIAQVQHVDLDEMLSLPRPRIEDKAAAQGSAPWTGPDENTPAANPYLPTQDTGAVKFKEEHPEWDGRGITIGILDAGIDLDHPALEKTTTGERKVSNWITVTDPLTEGDGTWLPMLTHVSGASATYAGADWKLPQRDGSDFAIRILKESIAANQEGVDGDIDRDGKTGGAWGVLYDYKTGDIWVDVNGNHDFTDDELMRPYAEKQQVGHFGSDNPATPELDRMPFVVQFKKGVDLTPAGREGQTADFVNIGMTAGEHGTHVAGITSANMPGWKMAGAAPGAQLVSAKACIYDGGCTAVALTEGMIELAANQHVDIINMSIGGLPALNDGVTTRTALYNRLIDEYGVQIVISGGNSGPGTNTIGDPSVASDVISVAAGASKDTWLANYGAKATKDYWIQNYSSLGPREDGGFKPNVLAPGSAISTVPMFMVPSGVPQTGYKLPIGIDMLNGTSMAAPETTGAAALLLSAARQSDVAVTPKQLRASLYSSTKLIDGLSVAAQGNGLVQVPAAWDLLKDSPKVDNAYTVKAPVCTPLAKLLKDPGFGTGLYNRCGAKDGGQKVGEARTYDVVITRTEGGEGDSRHVLNWVGDDGTFSSPAEVDLPLGRAVTVQVTAQPKTKGAHAAILEIDAKDAKVHIGQMMADVIATDSLEDAPYRAADNGTVERVQSKSYFVTVPKGAKALQVNLAGLANGSAVRFLAVNPYGVPVETSAFAGKCYTVIGDNKTCNPTSRAYLNPTPGVWEITVDASRRTPITQNPFRLTTVVQGVTVDPETQTLDRATVGLPTRVSWVVKNGFGDVTIKGRGGPLGSGRTERPSIKNGEKQAYTVDVPEGMEKLDVAIGNPSAQSADLDLVVKDASGAVVGKSAGNTSGESVTVAAPKPGRYTVEVDAYSVPGDGVQYDYSDVYYGAALGKLDVISAERPLKAGAIAVISGSIVPRTEVSEGRKLFGEMKVVTSEGAVLGTGKVIVAKVDKG